MEHVNTSLKSQGWRHVKDEAGIVGNACVCVVVKYILYLLFLHEFCFMCFICLPSCLNLRVSRVKASKDFSEIKISCQSC